MHTALRILSAVGLTLVACERATPSLLDAPHKLDAVQAADAPAVGRAPACTDFGAPTIIMNLTPTTVTDLTTAIASAAAYLRSHPESVYLVQLPAGTFDLSLTTVADVTVANSGAFNVSGISPTEGRIYIQGAGSAATHLILHDSQQALSGADFSRVCISGVHFGWKTPTVSQGTVVSVSAGHVVMQIAAGFPSPMDIYNENSDQGRYIREFVVDANGPRPKLVEPLCVPADMLAWKDATLLADGTSWDLALVKTTLVPPFLPGAQLAIKSKHGTLTGAGWFRNGHDLALLDLMWTDHSRVVFREVNEVAVIANQIRRRLPINGVTPFLSTPEGGPQLGQPADPPVTGMRVHQLYADATGDDPVAFFNATGTVSDSTLRDSFSGRCILEMGPTSLTKTNNTLDRVLPCVAMRPRAWAARASSRYPQTAILQASTTSIAPPRVSTAVPRRVGRCVRSWKPKAKATPASMVVTVPTSVIVMAGGVAKDGKDAPARAASSEVATASASSSPSWRLGVGVRDSCEATVLGPCGSIATRAAADCSGLSVDALWVGAALGSGATTTPCVSLELCTNHRANMRTPRTKSSSAPT